MLDGGTQLRPTPTPPELRRKNTHLNAGQTGKHTSHPDRGDGQEKAGCKLTSGKALTYLKGKVGQRRRPRKGEWRREGALFQEKGKEPDPTRKQELLVLGGPSLESH